MNVISGQLSIQERRSVMPDFLQVSSQNGNVKTSPKLAQLLPKFAKLAYSGLLGQQLNLDSYKSYHQIFFVVGV